MELTQKLIEQIADKYVVEAESLVAEGKCCPPIYKFVSANFRPISGYDPEWYKALNGVRDTLRTKGYRFQKMRQGDWFESFMDYEYWYPRELTELGFLICTEEEMWKKLMSLSPQYSSENA